MSLIHQITGKENTRLILDQNILWIWKATQISNSQELESKMKWDCLDYFLEHIWSLIQLKSITPRELRKFHIFCRKPVVGRCYMFKTIAPSCILNSIFVASAVLKLTKFMQCTLMDYANSELIINKKNSVYPPTRLDRGQVCYNFEYSCSATGSDSQRWHY